MKKGVWIRIAGNATNIKARRPHGWRCYVHGQPTETALLHWCINGAVSPENCIPGISATGDEHGLVAWIDYFGSYEIKNEILYVDLAMPTAPPPARTAQQ